LRRRLDSVQQETKEALRESFHSTAESAGPEYQDMEPIALPEKTGGWVPVGRMEVSRRKENPVKALIGEPEKA
jgi:hypothetical protein